MPKNAIVPAQFSVGVHAAMHQACIRASYALALVEFSYNLFMLGPLLISAIQKCIAKKRLMIKSERIAISLKLRV